MHEASPCGAASGVLFGPLKLLDDRRIQAQPPRQPGDELEDAAEELKAVTRSVEYPAGTWDLTSLRATRDGHFGLMVCDGLVPPRDRPRKQRRCRGARARRLHRGRAPQPRPARRPVAPAGPDTARVAVLEKNSTGCCRTSRMSATACCRLRRACPPPAPARRCRQDARVERPPSGRALAPSRTVWPACPSRASSCPSPASTSSSGGRRSRRGCSA